MGLTFQVLSGHFEINLMQIIPEIEELIKLISKLPGLGPKSSRRIILKLINNKDELHKPMINSLANLFKNVLRCNICGSLKSIKTDCINCERKEKKMNKICIVENIADQWSIENSNIFNGYFHILGGTISGLQVNNKNKLLISGLIEQVKRYKVDEVIIATSATVEGQTTAFYIQDVLRDLNLTVTKLAQGVPIGGEIENLDDGTLISAFKK